MKNLTADQQILFDSFTESQKRFFWSKSIIFKQKVLGGSGFPQSVQKKLDLLITNGFQLLSGNEFKEGHFVHYVYEFDITQATFQQRLIIWDLDPKDPLNKLTP